jgi:hypothetical protein
VEDKTRNQRQRSSQPNSVPQSSATELLWKGTVRYEDVWLKKKGDATRGNCFTCCPTALWVPRLTEVYPDTLKVYG